MDEVGTCHTFEVRRINSPNEIRRRFAFFSVTPPKCRCFLGKIRPFGDFGNRNFREEVSNVRGNRLLGMLARKFIDLCEPFGKGARCRRLFCRF